MKLWIAPQGSISDEGVGITPFAQGQGLYGGRIV